MLTHTRPVPAPPERVVILGAGGFVGGGASKALSEKGCQVLRLTRDDVDLSGDEASTQLANLLKPTDALVVTSAKAPCKDGAMLETNIRMMNAVCDAIGKVAPDYVCYVSSDAVYADEPAPLTEQSVAAPTALHGVMHLARELMLADRCSGPLGIIRPTLIYGPGDPHNGYGPNRFRRLVAGGDDVVLFGQGEERRDHIHIDDVSEIVARMVLLRSSGVLNAASGVVVSFRDIAEVINDLYGKPVQVIGSPRSGPMPHNGYRPFDIAAIGKAFPGFSPLPPSVGMVKFVEAEKA